MSNPFGFLSEEAYEGKMDALTSMLGDKMDSGILMLSAIASGNGGIAFKSFADIKMLNRLGLARRILREGDELVCAKATSMNATVGNSSGTAGITAASVNMDKFLAAVGESGNIDYEFTWDGAAWQLSGNPVELTAYGVTVTGTPSVGDEIVVHETANVLTWTVIGIDKDTPVASDLTHSITLQLRDCYADLQFDAREALFSFPEGLEAGTYYFTVKQHSWVSTDVNKSFQFTLENAIPAGGQIVLSAAYNVTLENSQIKVYASASASEASETTTLVIGTSGTNLGDVNNAGNGTTINSLQRALTGSNNYADSAMRQWLNSNKPMGSVWAPQTAFDRAPSWLTTVNGFLYGMDEDFLSSIGEVTKVTALNTVSDGGGSITTAEKFFLLSRSEVYGGKENNINEGDPYPYYADNSDLSAPGTGADTNRIKYRNGTAKYWWLRSLSAGYANYVRYCDPSGAVYGSIAHIARGVAPACCIV